MKNNNRRTNIIIVLLIILTVFVSGLLIYFWRQQEINRVRISEKLRQKNSANTEIQINDNTEPTTYVQDNLTDENIVDTPVVSPTSSASDIQLIQTAFANKYNRPATEVNLTVLQNTGTHASGSVTFAGEIGGGMWFAYKQGNSWKLAYDGNGSPTCADIIPYNFPSEIISECWDQAQNEMIKL